MLLKLHGRHLHALSRTSDGAFIGRICEYAALPEAARAREILLVRTPAGALPPGFRAYLLHEPSEGALFGDVYVLAEEMRYLAHGDIVRIVTAAPRGGLARMFAPAHSLARGWRAFSSARAALSRQAAGP